MIADESVEMFFRKKATVEPEIKKETPKKREPETVQFNAFDDSFQRARVILRMSGLIGGEPLVGGIAEAVSIYARLDKALWEEQSTNKSDADNGV